MKTIIWLLLLWIPITCIAQLNPGARQIALSNSDAAMHDDVFSVFNNTAGLAWLTKKQIGIFYSPSPFGLKELANGAICLNYPLTDGSLGLGVTTYGFELYKENKFTLCYANEFYGNASVGLSVNYLNISIKNYGGAGTLFFNAGVLYQPVGQLSWGFHISNVTRSKIGQSNAELPVTVNTGISYTPISKLLINAALEKDILYSASLRFGAEYTFFDVLSLRGGFATEPGTYSAGIGINYLYFNCSYAVASHPELGFTHQFGLVVSFDN